MTPAQYIMGGMMTLMFFMVDSMNNPSNPDWSKMPNPFTKEYQMTMVTALFVFIMIWPLVLALKCVDLVRKM